MCARFPLWTGSLRRVRAFISREPLFPCSLSSFRQSGSLRPDQARLTLSASWTSTAGKVVDARICESAIVASEVYL